MGYFSDLKESLQKAVVELDNDNNTVLVHDKVGDDKFRKSRYIKCCVCGNGTVTNLFCMKCTFNYRKKEMVFAFRLTQEETCTYKEDQIISKSKATEANVNSLNDMQKITPKQQSLKEVAHQEIHKEVVYLNSCLTDIATSSEYEMVDGHGKEINVATALDYHRLILKLKELSSRVFFIGIAQYMDETGYDVEGEKYSDIMHKFFSMAYNEQARVLSNMFMPPSVFKGFRIYTCRELIFNPFVPVEYTNDNRDTRYWKVNRKATNVFEVEQRENENSLRKVPVKRENAKVYPNDPCPCGSGKRFKVCHGRARHNYVRS